MQLVQSHKFQNLFTLSYQNPLLSHQGGLLFEV